MKYNLFFVLLMVVNVVVSNENMQYLLGQNDLISIEVFREKDLSRTIRINAEGFVSFPLIGKVKAAGLSVNQLEQDLSTRLKEYILNPFVSVSINEYSKIVVLGQVKNPGSYTLTDGLSVVEAVALFPA